MKRLLLPVIIAASLLAFATTHVLAEPPKIEHVIDLLHEAKDAKDPVPLLEKAHEALKDFNPVPAKDNGAKKKNSANKAGAQEHKHKAMEAIADAIKTAKEGGDAKPKIEHAVALAHAAGDAKN